MRHVGRCCRTWQRAIRLSKMQAASDRLKQSFILLEHTQVLGMS